MAKMHHLRLFLGACAIFAATALLLTPADAQTRRAAARAAPAVPTTVQIAAVEPKEKCLRALNGACTNPISVEAVRLRAMIIPAVRVSYFGTPAGTVGGDYIPFERFFQDNPIVFGLPTFTLVNPACCVTRTK
jgi:hypothetical protein